MRRTHLLVLVIALVGATVAAPLSTATAAPPIVNPPDWNGSSVYPYPDGYRDSVNVLITGIEGVDDLDFSVENLDGDVVYADSTMAAGNASFTWTGRSLAGQLLPDGPYYMYLTVTDAEDNTITFPTKPVHVSAMRLVDHTITKKVSVKASDSARWKGKCSTFSRPKGRHWKNGLGLYSNTLCKSGKWKKSGIVLVSAVQLPAAHKYGALDVYAYGGAAKSHRRSSADLDIWSATHQGWKSSFPLRPRVGWHHASRLRNGGQAIFGEGWIEWRTLTAYGSKYDLKKFKITLDYTALE